VDTSTFDLFEFILNLLPGKKHARIHQRNGVFPRAAAMMGDKVFRTRLPGMQTTTLFLFSREIAPLSGFSYLY